VLRDGERETLDIVIEPLDGEQRVASAGSAPSEADKSSRLGVVVAEVPDREREALGVDNGVLVSEVDPDGPAAKAGIVVGDVIVSLNRKKVDSVAALGELLDDSPAGDAVPVLVQRDSAPLFLALTLPAENG